LEVFSCFGRCRRTIFLVAASLKNDLLQNEADKKFSHGLDPELTLQPAYYRTARDSFTLDVDRLKDRPPFLDIGLVGGGERLGRLLVGLE
jgi:hypothetical protein